MKLERLQEYVLPVVATLCGMGFAIVVGNMMGQGRFGHVAAMLGVLFLGFVTMVMRQYIWLLIVIAWPWTGKIPLIPGPFSVRHLAVIAVVASFLALKALKVARRKTTYELADLLLGLMLVYLVTVFVRNPVGTLFTNSPRVGGKPYFEIFVAGIAYWILCRASVAGSIGVRTVVLGSLLSNYALGFLNFLADISGKAARVLANFYTDLVGVKENAAPTVETMVSDPEVTRLTYLAPVGIFTNLTLVSFFRPITLIQITHPLRVACFGFGTLLCLLSGFRNSIVITIGLMAVGTYLRSGWMDVVRLGVVGFACTAVLVAGNGRLFDLPLGSQRALCFLPGKWDPTAVQSARDSSQWRFQMWAEMLKSNKYVRSRLLGDGFGFMKRDLEAIAFLQWRGGGDSLESTLVVGNLHSGPLTTIRVAGYVGLCIYLTFLVVLARTAWRLIRRAANTEFLPLALFVGLPLTYEPLFFVFVFGSFDASLPNMMFALGMMKMVSNSLDDRDQQKRLEVAAVQVREPAPRYALAAGGR